MLPQPTAKGRNQSGIIAGKLNGVIAPITPTGWRTISTSTPRAIALEVLALSRCGTAIAASIDSIPRPTSAKASSKVLPMSGVTRAGELLLVVGDERAQGEEGAGADLGRRAAPGGEGGARGGGRGVDVVGARERDLGEHLAGGRRAALERPSPARSTQAPPT